MAHVTRAAPASRDAAHAIATVLQRPHDPKAAMADPSAEVSSFFFITLQPRVE